MKLANSHLALLLLWVALFFLLPSLQAETITYVKLDPPGSTQTEALGISGNNVVGWYVDSNSVTHGFFYNGSTYTTLDPTGSTSTKATAVDGTNVVGSYTDSSNVTHGFLYNGSTYTTLDPPNSTNTQPMAISGNNVVGVYFPNGGQGFLYDGTTYTQLDPPGAQSTVATGVSGNTIVGWYLISGSTTHPFVYNGGFVTTSDPPTAENTRLLGISGANVVGYFLGSDNVPNGLLYNNGTYTTIDPPGSTNTQALAVSGNNVVGKFVDNSITHGFFYNGSSFYTVTPTGATTTVGLGVSGNKMVGYYIDSKSVTHGFMATAIPGPATVTLSGLTAIYNGMAQSAKFTTTPAGLSVALTYNGSSTPPTAAGSYAVVATVTNPNYIGSKSGTFVIGKATAAVTLNNLSPTFDGSPEPISATTNPPGLTVNFTYNGGTTAPTAAGLYTVVGTVSDPNYQGSVTATELIGNATVTLGNLSATYDGTTHAATAVTSPAGLSVTFTYNGSVTAPKNAGSYAVVGTIKSASFTGRAMGTLVISKATASVTFTAASLNVAYSGTPKTVTATTVPTGLKLTFTYNGSATAPTLVGAYPVVATVVDANHVGTANGTLNINAVNPVVTTTAASGVNATGARFNGTVNTKGAATTVSFQYGTTTGYGSTTPGQSVTAGTATVNFFANIGGITAQTTPVVYHYQAVAVDTANSALMALGADKTFTTLPMPTVGINPLVYLGASGAELVVGINPNGIATSVFFQYGTTTAYGSQTGLINVGNGKTTFNTYALFGGLTPNTTYHYRMVSTSAAGTFPGPDETFTTLNFDIQLVAAKGTTATGTGTTFAAFDNPAVDVNDTVAFLGELTNESPAFEFGIWTIDNTNAQHLLVQLSSGAPGTNGVFATLGDPVINDTDKIAFRGTLKIGAGGVTSVNDTGIWSNSSGTLQLVAQEGGAAPSTTGTLGTFSAFTSLGLSNSGTVILATIVGGGITTANNMGVWEGTTTNDLALKLQLGQMVGGKTITKLAFMPVAAYVNGQARSFNATGDLVSGATFSDKSTGLVKVVSGTAQLLLASGTAADGVSGASYSAFGNPTINDGDHTAFQATMTGGVTTANNIGLWADDSTGTRQLIARSGTGAAPGQGITASFVSFSDPVYNNNEAVAFRGTLKVGTGQATSTTASGIWCNSAGSLELVAQQGVTPAPGCPGGATFSAFTELALPDQGGSTNKGGAVFLATLNTNTTANVNTTNNLGIWAVDNSGALQLIVRTGDDLNGKLVTGLSFLPNIATVGGQSRNFSQANGDLAFLATFSDKSTAIFNVVF